MKSYLHLENGSVFEGELLTTSTEKQSLERLSFYRNDRISRSVDRSFI